MWRAMSTSPCSPSPSSSPWWVQRKKKGEKRARGAAARPAASRAARAASRQGQPPGTPRRRSMLLPPAPLGHPGHGGAAAPLRSARDGAGAAPSRGPREFGGRWAPGAELNVARAGAAPPHPPKSAPSPPAAAGMRGTELGVRGLGIIYFPRCRGGREGKVPPLLLCLLLLRRRPLLPLLALRAGVRCCRCGDESCVLGSATCPLFVSGPLPCPCSCAHTPASAPDCSLLPALANALFLPLDPALTPESLPLLPPRSHVSVLRGQLRRA